jgi:ABC-type nitrate/sulfonate/bicarbonate transport system substrate-binding protein
MKTRRSGWALGILRITAVALILAACSPAATPVPPTQPPQPTQAPASTQPPAATNAPALQKITFQAGYLAQGNISFVAAYVAKEKGFFAQEGLDVTIEHASPGGGEQFQRLAAKAIQFTTQTGDAFAQSMAQVNPPFVGVAMFGHQTDAALLVLDNSPIKTLKDLAGKKIGIKTAETASPPWLLGMLNQAGLTFKDVQLLQVGYDPRVVLPDFGAGQVDALQVFRSNEPDTLGRLGDKSRLFLPSDYGITFLGQMYITNKDFVRDDPEMVRKFVRATMKGLQFTLDPANDKEVTDIVMKYAGSDADRAHQAFIWHTEATYVTADSTKQVGLGYASDQEWQDMMSVMVKYGSIKAAVPVAQLWDPQFVKSIYNAGQLVWP